MENALEFSSVPLEPDDLEPERFSDGQPISETFGRTVRSLRSLATHRPTACPPPGRATLTVARVTLPATNCGLRQWGSLDDLPRAPFSRRVRSRCSLTSPRKICTKKPLVRLAHSRCSMPTASARRPATCTFFSSGSFALLTHPSSKNLHQKAARSPRSLAVLYANGVRSTTCHVHLFLVGFVRAAHSPLLEKSAPKSRSFASLTRGALCQRRPLDDLPRAPFSRRVRSRCSLTPPRKICTKKPLVRLAHSRCSMPTASARRPARRTSGTAR